MRVEIVGLSQEMSLLDGSFKNILRLRFEDNTMALATVEDATVVKVTELFAKAGGPAVSRVLESAADSSEFAQQPEFTQPAQQQMVLDDAGYEEFGGNYGPDAASDSAQDEYEARPAPVVTQRATGRLQVSADERGNPVIRGRNVVDAEDVMGGRGADEEEDGVGSV